MRNLKPKFHFECSILAMISLPSHIRSAIIVGNSVHLIAEGMSNKYIINYLFLSS
jgi:hypothetical protein